MDRTQQQLIADAKRGDTAAFAGLYELYARDLYRFALYYMRNPYNAEDAVQDAVLQAFRSIAALRKDDSFRSWLFKILSNVCKRKLVNEQAHISDFSVEETPDLACDENASEALSSAIAVRDAIGSLPEEERQIVLLSVTGGYRSGEIAQMLGMNAATVRSKLSRSLAKMRTLLSEECEHGQL